MEPKREACTTTSSHLTKAMMATYCLLALPPDTSFGYQLTITLKISYIRSSSLQGGENLTFDSISQPFVGSGCVSLSF